jgi:hypothetical protein
LSKPSRRKDALRRTRSRCGPASDPARKYDARSAGRSALSPVRHARLSGVSSDFRELLVSTEPRARFAVELFCYRVARHIASLAAAMGGLDGIVFTAGVGENGHGPQGNMEELALSSLHPLKSWSLRQTRCGSLHPKIGLVVERRRGLLREIDQATAEARCMPLARRSPGRDQALPRGDQRQPQTFRLDRRPRCDHRGRQAFSP